MAKGRPRGSKNKRNVPYYRTFRRRLIMSRYMKPLRPRGVVNISSPGASLPNRLHVKTGYKEIHFTNSVSSASNNYFNFCVNGIYDPDPLVGGNSATLFDNLMLLYRKYRVRKCKVDVEILSEGTSQPSLFYMLAFTGDIAPSTNRAHGMAGTYAPQVASALIDSGCLPSQPQSGRKTRASLFLDFDKILGGKTVNDDDFSGTSGANPVNSQYVQIGLSATNGTSAVSNTVCISLTYYTDYEDPITEEQITED